MSTELLEAIETLEKPKSSSIVVRELPISDWGLLVDAFRIMGDELPNPLTAVIFIAIELTEDSPDKILGFLVVQKVIHAEPLFIYPEAQGRGLHRILYDVVDRQMQATAKLAGSSFYLITVEDEAIERRALARGFKLIPGKIYGKEF